MADLKPLPALPSSLLSVEAQTHRASLFKHFLSDIHEHGIESRRGGWLYVFEEVLDDLSQHFIRGDWLARIKRTKEAHKSHNSPRDTVEQTEETRTEKPLPPKPEPPLQQLRKLAARPVPPNREQRLGHLVLCVAPHGSRLPLPAEDSGFDVVPANIGCEFSPGTFALQEQGHEELDGPVLYGLSDGLEVGENLRLVGGTFTFKGVTSPMQHHLLRKALGLAVYVHLSLLLEQAILSNSGVRLNFARPKLPAPSPSTPLRSTDDTTHTKESISEPTKGKSQRSSIVPSSFTNFFLKRGFSYRRSNTINPPAGRNGGSLDLNALHPSTSADATTPRRSIEGAVSGLRLRRLSFLGDRRLSLRKSTSQPIQVKTEPPPYHPFLAAAKRIEESRSCLSTSPGVSLSVPKLILELAEKEKRNDAQGGPLKRRLKGDERVALTSLLGWDGKDAEGRGMSGILGFVRHQEISVLCSAHVPPGPSTKSQSSHPNSPPNSPPSIGAQTPTSSSTSTQSKDDSALEPTRSAVALTTSSQMSASTTANLPQSGLIPCGKPLWITYQYYSTRNGNDFALGEWLHDTAMRRTISCETPGCKFLQGQHERRLIHDGVRLVIRLFEASGKEDKGKEKQMEDNAATDTGDNPDDADILVWESCAVCDAKTPRTKMSDGTFLSSFAKYLELLIYSPSICVLTPSLCEHTNPPSGPRSTLPWSRFNIIRHFSTHSTDISIALSPIEDIFELRVPKLQITRGLDKYTPASALSPDERQVNEGLQKRALRKEIKKWWERVSDHLDKIEDVLNAEEQSQKALPRLPSMDSAYDVFDTPESEASSTPRAHDRSSVAFPPMPPSAPNSPADGVDPPPQDSYFITHSGTSTNTQTSQTPTVPPKDTDDSRKLLAALRHNFQKVEQLLYTQLAQTSEGSLNDVRRAFLATAEGTKKRLKAWQKKHLSAAKAKLVGELVADEPPWWDKRCHAVPGGNIIVREDDWGSIIAHTLSTTDYLLELANLSMVRSGSASQLQPNPSPAVESGTSSFFSVASGYKLFSSSSKNQPDPDQENVVWNEPEAYSSAISRKENTKDSTSLLAIRDVLRQKSVPEQSNGPPSATSSRLSSLSSSHIAMPSAVKSKPDIGLTMQEAGGKVNASDAGEHASEVLLQGLGHVTTSRPASTRSGITPSASPEPIPAHVKEESGDSVTSSESVDSQNTIGKNGVPGGNNHSKDASAQPNQLPPPLPPKDDPKTPPEHISLPSTSTAPSAWYSPSGHEAAPSQSSGFASTLASGLSSAMRYVMKSEPVSRTPTPLGTANTNTKSQHHVLLADIATFDERPHIKYDWTIGKRLKFSCTVYYAKQFDMLRKRCGIHDVFLKSLSKSTNWMAEGGKSKSNFWKTSDDRFIIKTLVNAWNVADLQVLVDFAPSYFRYMDATASKPTVLCKVLGFYTIEIKNLETGATQSKADLLVMENLFFNQNINKTFDLKGIQGRKVKSHGDTTKTFFDGEWIEGQQRTLTLVRPHSKVILRDAIKNDAEFLARSNIMDYSLLLGVDEQKKEIACGLVDTIGSYTFAKTLEYKAKQGLQSGKEVTVMPPTEYQERFVSALEGYFVACPDKWSKPLDESKIINDPDLLPSVL